MILSTDSRLPLEHWITQEGLDALPLLVFVYTTDGTLVAGNTAAETFWGVPREGRGRINLYDDPRNASAADEIENVTRDGQLKLLRGQEIHSPTGETIWHDMSYVPLADERGTVHYVAIMCVDVTQSIERQRAVDRAEVLIAAQQSRIDELEAAKAEIQRQRVTIAELSTPLIDVWRGILLLPMIGTLTDDRMSKTIERLLPAITERNTRTTIIDLTGITEVDTNTARQILEIRSMVTLLGAECVLVGIQSSVARTLAELDIGLAGIRVFATVSSALERTVGAAAQRAREPKAVPVAGAKQPQNR